MDFVIQLKNYMMSFVSFSKKFTDKEIFLPGVSLRDTCIRGKFNINAKQTRILNKESLTGEMHLKDL